MYIPDFSWNSSTKQACFSLTFFKFFLFKNTFKKVNIGSKALKIHKQIPSTEDRDFWTLSNDITLIYKNPAIHSSTYVRIHILSIPDQNISFLNFLNASLKASGRNFMNLRVISNKTSRMKAVTHTNTILPALTRKRPSTSFSWNLSGAPTVYSSMSGKNNSEGFGKKLSVPTSKI